LQEQEGVLGRAGRRRRCRRERGRALMGFVSGKGEIGYGFHKVSIYFHSFFLISAMISSKLLLPYCLGLERIPLGASGLWTVLFRIKPGSHLSHSRSVPPLGRCPACLGVEAWIPDFLGAGIAYLGPLQVMPASRHRHYARPGLLCLWLRASAPAWLGPRIGCVALDLLAGRRLSARWRSCRGWSCPFRLWRRTGPIGVAAVARCLSELRADRFSFSCC
jgi:hypothetical protein